MNEPDVVVAIAEYLDDRGYQFFVDANTYPSPKVTELVNRLENCHLNDTIRIGNRIPDIIGYTDEMEIFAIEAKGSSGIRKGIGQASFYRQGVHKSFIAAKESALTEYRDTILGNGLGIYSVRQETDGSVKVSVTEPMETVAATELNKTRRALAIKTSDFESDKNAFSSSTMPLNAFLPVIITSKHGEKWKMEKKECRKHIVDHEHGLGQSTSNHAFALSRTLQLTERSSENSGQIEVTDFGRMGYFLLKGKVSDINEWSMGLDQSQAPDTPEDRILQYIQHMKDESQYRSTRVYQSSSEVAAFLRGRYLTIPDVRQMTKVLSSHRGVRAELSEILSEIAMEIPETFLNLFVESSREDEFKELMDGSTIDPKDSNLQERILDLSSPDYLYNFVSQLIHVKILTDKADPVHQKDDDPQRGDYYWEWDKDVVGDLGLQMM